MPTSIKIYPPSKLPDRNVSETQFNIWSEELEVYLSQERDFSMFLPGGRYETWSNHEINPLRINDIKQEDRYIAGNVYVGVDQEPLSEEDAERLNADVLDKVRKNLRTVLSIIGKCVSEGHYTSIVKHSTSIEWIYSTLRSDYDIQQKGIHFFNILDVKYESSKDTPVSFYNQYRTVVSNNLAKSGDIIAYKNNLELTIDEAISPMLEDMILLNVIREIDERLPIFVKTHYMHKMKKEQRLMDFKSDILVNIPSFLKSLEEGENKALKMDDTNTELKAFKKTPKTARSNTYCRLCFKSGSPREVFASHNLGDEKCPQLSKQDRLKLKQTLGLNKISDDHDSPDDDELAEMFGYSCHTDENQQEVLERQIIINNKSHCSDGDLPNCSILKPVSSQILTVFKEKGNKVPIHLDLDSGANLNFCREDVAIKNGFKIYPNTQKSKLGDGKTKISAVGEIRENFYRNNWEVKYEALVCKELASPFIAGTPFLKSNSIEQDFIKDMIHVHNKKFSVPSTNPISILPTGPILKTKPKLSRLATLNKQILLPDQTLDYIFRYNAKILWFSENSPIF